MSDRREQLEKIITSHVLGHGISYPNDMYEKIEALYQADLEKLDKCRELVVDTDLSKSSPVYLSDVLKMLRKIKQIVAPEPKKPLEEQAIELTLDDYVIGEGVNTKRGFLEKYRSTLERLRKGK